MFSSRMWIPTATLGIALSLPLSISAHAGPVSSNADAQNSAALRVPRVGALVRMRSGGPLMMVTGIQGDQVICEWTEGGEPRSNNFPAAALALPLTAPPNIYPDNDEHAADRYYQKHCPSGSLTFTGNFECSY
jgi:uncharacterized protein YodC (DUF2158 family)